MYIFKKYFATFAFVLSSSREHCSKNRVQIDRMEFSVSSIQYTQTERRYE